MRVVGYTSGAKPCGIADYHQKVAAGLTALDVQCDTVALPTGSVYRDQPLALWRRRQLYAGLAARSSAYDAVLLNLLTQWNGFRTGENMLPAFINHLHGPVFMTLHEWPAMLAPESGLQSLSKEIVTQLVGLASQFGERRGIPYEQWMANHVFGRASHILVHADALRDRLLALGIPAERITLETFPIPSLPARASSEIVDEFAQRFAHRRKIVNLRIPASAKVARSRSPGAAGIARRRYADVSRRNRW